jgi:TolB protein
MYEAATGQLTSPLIDLPAEVQGLAWQSGMFADLLPKWLVGSALTGRPALYQAKLSLSPIAPKGRAIILPVPDVTAPYPYLQDSVDEAFNALRAATADTSGWDFLGNLENAYLPLTEPLRPGMSEEWLYTGRAFAVNPLPMQAGWMVVTRELFSGETYWRIWIKARYQDGSQGQPLKQSPWNLDARYTGDPISYEQGGAYTPVQSGYWIDFTELAQRFDWQRTPALRNWRTFYPAARFNHFLQPGTLNWSGAMNEVYPVEALDPPTPIPTLTTTPVPTKTPRYNPSVTVEPTATITTTPTRRPTWTAPAPTSQP